MPCQHVRLPDGSGAIVCGSRQERQRCACGRPATLLCDWKGFGAAPDTPTCGAPICSHCTTSPAPDKDLCREHAEQWHVAKLKRSA